MPVLVMTVRSYLCELGIFLDNCRLYTMPPKADRAG